MRSQIRLRSRRHTRMGPAALALAVGLATPLSAQARPAEQAPFRPAAQATAPACGPTPSAGRFADATGSATVTVVAQGADCRRTYRLVSTLSGTRQFSEPAGLPRVRSGSALLDGMYAMSMEEARLNRSSTLTDAAYNDEKPVACPGGCYVTGANWPYVWTRDAAYAADLGLTAIDPQRMRNTLAFKLSARRDRPGGTQILQDTGTGGSYPNSTDRTSWVLGATEILDWLPPAQRDAFAGRAYEAIRNTVEHDRAAVYDPAPACTAARRRSSTGASRPIPHGRPRTSPM